MSNINELKPIISLNPFARFCCTIGNLPSSYMASLTYEEQLLWFCDYLQNTVIPAVNNNAEVVKELQELYVKLKNYVDNYFNNLDIQNEINNKLDEMAQDGTLEEIISSYLNVKAILSFNTLQEMKSATNIINGSVCRILGRNNYNDGLGALYKIRTVTSSDNVDNDNIVALNISNTLIGEKIKNVIEEDITVVLGDSYGAQTESWVTEYAKLNNLTLNKNLFNFSYGGCGFVGDSAENNFLSRLQQFQGAIPNKRFVKTFIVAGGWNDRGHSEQINSAMVNLVNYIKANYPNAKIYVGMIANYNAIDDTAGNIYWRQTLQQTILPLYQQINELGGLYLTGVEQVMHNYSLFKDDDIHPNAEGAKKLGQAINKSLNGGYYAQEENKIIYTQFNSSHITLSEQMDSSTNCAMQSQIKNGIMYHTIYGTLKPANVNTHYLGLTLNIGTFTKDQIPYFRYVNNKSGIKVIARAKDNTNNYHLCYGILQFNRNATITLTLTFEHDVQNINDISFMAINDTNILYN